MGIDNLLESMKATNIPCGEWGLWRIAERVFTEKDVRVIKKCQRRDVRPGPHKFLHRYTDSTLHNGGEIVMEDTHHELSRHLSFILGASGKVLVTGLGLGCVVRGLLTRDDITRIDVVESSRDVLLLVRPYMPSDSRLTIHEADAFEFVSNTDVEWDCAWHDIWTDTDVGEPHLSLAHTDLMWKCRKRVKHQGAWNYPRWMHRGLFD